MFKGVIGNPIVLSALVGVALNLIFASKPPTYIQAFLTQVGSSFSATALFVIGLSMVSPPSETSAPKVAPSANLPLLDSFLGGGNGGTGQPGSSKDGYLEIVILTLLKCVLVPMAAYQATTLLSTSLSSNKDDSTHQDAALLALIYGCTPTATAVYVKKYVKTDDML